jgi:arylsulfatase A-like enzyme
MMVKKICRISFFLIYIFLFLAFGVTTVKPGSAIYYAKYDLQADWINLKGDTIEYQLALNKNYFNKDTLLVREGARVLEHIKTEELPFANTGVFAVENEEGDSVVVRIIPVSETSLTAYKENLQILVRPFWVRSPWIQIIFIFLSSGLVLFVVTIFVDYHKRKAIFSSIFGVFKLFDQTDQPEFLLKTKLLIIKHSVIESILIAFLYVFMEWLFFTTKSSFMDVLSFTERLGVMFNTGLAVSIVVLMIFLGIILLDICFSLLITPFHSIVYHIPAAFMAASLGLILLDNFTYTVFGFGVVTAKTLGKLVYALGFISLFVYALRKFELGVVRNEDQKRIRWGLYGSVGLIGVAIVFAAVSVNPLRNPLTEVNNDGENSRLPNIILLGNDGLNAENMSVYGYERETTPFLEELALDSLVMENNFTNADKSTGSDVTILTGKLPFETGVLFPPNKLTDIDMYEHLPGILKQYGYQTASFGVAHFVDMDKTNLKNAFDYVNGKKSHSFQILDKAVLYGYSDMVNMVFTITDRITERIQHIFFIKAMENPFALVTEARGTYTLSEQAIMNRLLKDLEEAQMRDQPLFTHIHWVSTHGPLFTLSSQTFSAGQKQDQDWMLDFYDDAILNYDQNIKELVQHLKENGLYDETILMIYTDHGHRWTVEDRIPLIIHFPYDQYAGTVTASTQNMDISATILEYLGIEQPPWMSGDSLLKEPDQTRVIYAAEIKNGLIDRGHIVEEKMIPPFYQFGFLDAIQCQRFYQIDLQELTMKVTDIDGHTDPCDESMLDSPEEIWSKAGELLISFGYELPETWGK